MLALAGPPFNPPLLPKATAYGFFHRVQLTTDGLKTWKPEVRIRPGQSKRCWTGFSELNNLWSEYLGRAQYIAAQRDKFLPQAAPLTAAQRSAMADYFLPEVLDAARVIVLHGTRVEDPPLLRRFEQHNVRLPDFPKVANGA